jgi:aldose sugar dehydrogenase
MQRTARINTERRTVVLLGLAALAAPRGAVAQKASLPIKPVTLAHGLQRPWGLVFLPEFAREGGMLVTERPGRLRKVTAKGQLGPPITGVPKVDARGQGGMLDVALDPKFADNALVYLSYSEPGEGDERGRNGTAVARGRLDGDRLADVQVVFRQKPKIASTNHFGSRLVFAPDGRLFVTLGERFSERHEAQNLGNHIGKVVRIEADGRVPADNPFAKTPGAAPEVWSYGHRNVQGAALHPTTGALWVHEMGPRGGDELTIAQAGRNYGWPLVSWGRHYDGRTIPSPATRPDLGSSIRQWTPVIAPSGMTFYTGSLFPTWRGSLLVGGLVAQGVVRLTLHGQQVTGEERIALGQRIRDVRQGPDGAVYVLTDEASGEILRLTQAG